MISGATSNFLEKTQVSSPEVWVLRERMLDLNEFKNWLLRLRMDEIRTPKDFLAEPLQIFPARL